MDEAVIRAIAKRLDVWPGLVSGTPGLGSPAGVAWGGVESLASVGTMNVPSPARVPANGPVANESRSRGNGHRTSGIGNATEADEWTK